MVSRWHGRVQGGLMIFASLAAGGLGLIVLVLLRKVAEYHREQRSEMDAVAVWLLEHRLVVLLPAVIALACGICLLIPVRGKWIWILAGGLATVATFALVIYAFLSLVGPLYEVAA